MAKSGFSGTKPKAPPKGTSGPNGKGGGTRTFTPPMPAPKKQGMK